LIENIGFDKLSLAGMFEGEYFLPAGILFLTSSLFFAIT
jgi:hypothetical protein